LIFFLFQKALELNLKKNTTAMKKKQKEKVQKEEKEKSRKKCNNEKFTPR